MPLTPTDVANKQFKIVFRGYSLDEVDGFLDEVESELTRLMRDNNDLRGGAGGPGAGLTPAFTAAPPRPVTDLTKAGASDGAGEPRGSVPAETPTETPAEPVVPTSSETIETVVGTPVVDVAAPEEPLQAAVAPEPVLADPDVQQAVAAGDGGRAALRMLQMAQATAEQAIAEARAEAEQLVTRTRTDTTQQIEGARAEAAATLAAARNEADAIVGPARSEAETTLTAARTEADRLLTGAQERAAALDAEIAARTERAMGDLETQRAVLEQNIEQLRAFEREYRSRLKAYLEGQLQELGGTGTAQSLEVPELEPPELEAQALEAAELEAPHDRAPQA